MKKILFLITIILSALVSVGQPVVNRSGPANTVSDARLKPQYNFIVPVYADTATANLTTNIGIDSCYAVIATRDSNYLWYRQCNPKMWVKLGSGGSSSGVNIYNSDGSLTGDRQLDGTGYYLRFNDLNEFGVGADSVSFNITGGIGFLLNDTGRFTKRVSYTSNLGSTFTRHTLVDKNYVDSSSQGKQALLSGTGIVKSTAGTISYLTDPLPIANGGTGSATKNFVDLTTNQTAAGNKTFSGNLKVYSNDTSPDILEFANQDYRIYRSNGSTNLIRRAAGSHIWMRSASGVETQKMVLNGTSGELWVGNLMDGGSSIIQTDGGIHTFGTTSTGNAQNIITSASAQSTAMGNSANFAYNYISSRGADTMNYINHSLLLGDTYRFDGFSTGVRSLYNILVGNHNKVSETSHMFQFGTGLYNYYGTTFGDWRFQPKFYFGNNNVQLDSAVKATFVIANGFTNDGSRSDTDSYSSHSFTHLKNGWTQINTTNDGFVSGGTTLTQADVTPKAALEVVSTTSGVLIPRLNTTQQNAISSPVTSLMIFNTDSAKYRFYNGSAWETIAGSSGGGTSYTFENGLTNTSGTVKLGGALTGNTSITGAYQFKVQTDSVYLGITACPDCYFQVDATGETKISAANTITLDAVGVTFPSITNSTTQDRLAGFINSSKAIGTIVVGSGLSLSSGTLSTTGLASSSTTISTTSPLSGGGDLSTNRTLTIADAAADGSTKGAASFTAADFNATTGNISIDYTNGQKATASQPGFMTAAQAARLDSNTYFQSGEGVEVETVNDSTYRWKIKAFQIWDSDTATTTNATITTASTITCPNDGAGVLTVTMVGVKTDGSKYITGEKKIQWTSSGGTVTIRYTTEILADYLTGFTTATWTVDASGGTLRIRVTGEATENVEWSPSYTMKYHSVAL